jgi:hypothetical protein
LERRNKSIEFKKDRRISVTILTALIAIVVVNIAVHLQSEYFYFGNASTILFWLTSFIGTIAAIITGLRCIDILTERSQVV